MKCVNCGKEIEETANFFPFCGSPQTERHLNATENDVIDMEANQTQRLLWLLTFLLSRLTFFRDCGYICRTDCIFLLSGSFCTGRQDRTKKTVNHYRMEVTYALPQMRL